LYRETSTALGTTGMPGAFGRFAIASIGFLYKCFDFSNQKSGRESRLLNVVGFVGESQPTRMCLYKPKEKNAGLSS
jgi:hypothetical protein